MFIPSLDLALLCFFTIIIRKVLLCFCLQSKPAKEDYSHTRDIKDLNFTKEKSCWYDYEDDFYKFHHLEECQVSTNSYGEKLIFDDRKILVDSMIDAHYALNLAPETLYLCVNIIDRFLSKFNPASTPIEKLQFVGLTSLLLASKYEERFKIHFVHIPMKDVRETEKLILQKLDWNLTVTTPYVFLVRNIKALSDEDKIMENMVFFFSELSLTHYSIVCDYKPSMIAASAVYCARIIVGRYPLWSNDLKICTGYSEKELRSCAMVMIELCDEICRDGTMHVFRKFSRRDYCEVACVAKREISKKMFYPRICLNMGQYCSFQFIKSLLKAIY